MARHRGTYQRQPYRKSESMSFFSFNLVGNALDAYQHAMGVTADNIANVATPGASRQSADVTEAVPISGSPFYSSHLGSPGTLGEGAVVNQITRIHQDSYDGLFRGASSSQYFYTTQQQQLANLQSNFGEPNNGINLAYGALQTAVSNAAAAPTQPAVRQAVLSQAQTFATAINSASSAISDQKATIVGQGTSLVTQVNTLIDSIAALNGQIRALSATGDNPNTYLDQRDYAIDRLAQIVPTTTSLQSNGSSLVSIAGRPVVSDTIAYHLAAPVVSTAANGTPTLVVGFANDPNPLAPAPIPLGTGQLGAFVDVYNNKLVTYAQQLDDFASASASEINRITQAGVDFNNNPGTALFATIPGRTITAATIAVAITDPTQLPLGLISTAAGSLTQPLNSATNTVSTSVPIDGYASLRNPPPAAALSGTLTVSVDGTSQTFAYDTDPSTTPPGNAATIGAFMTNFNAGKFGVTASYDPATQNIAFSRDPINIDAVHRGKQGSSASTAGFTITDSLGPAGTTPPAAPLPQGTPATGLLQALGATNINGVAQTPVNALGIADNGAANALLKLFTNPVGVGALQTTAGAVSSALPGPVTITEPLAGAFATLNVGQVLTIADATTGATQNVPVTAIDRLTGQITVTASAPINVADPITTAQAQTLGAAYQGLITEMGLDASTAKAGVATQSALASSIDAARQSVDGININEETQALLKFQSAYSAAAKTFSTLNDIMQTTLGLIR